jgi:hypothetical protein
MLFFNAIDREAKERYRRVDIRQVIFGAFWRFILTKATPISSQTLGGEFRWLVRSMPARARKYQRSPEGLIYEITRMREVAKFHPHTNSQEYTLSRALRYQWLQSGKQIGRRFRSA